jgi:hypothetical protein
MAAAISSAVSSLHGGEPAASLRTYGEAKEFLARHTRVVELCGRHGARVAICPQWQGRVMTSTCGGPDGPSFGFIHRELVESGEVNPHINNCGAEDRLWLSPEGGRFSLWFKPGAEQTLANWYTPPALNEGAYEATVDADGAHCRLTRQMKLRNASNSEFDLSVTREVRLLNEADLTLMLGSAAAKTAFGTGVKLVAFETVNTIRNQGPAMTEQKGLVSIWILSMLNAGPETVIIVPYQAGDAQERGAVVRSDYFGSVPAERLKVTPEAVLFRGDAHYRAKIGMSQKRAKNMLGSIDFQAGVLTLAVLSMPADPAKVDYMNNLWGSDPPNPYIGDCVNSYNDGPPAPGKKGFGPFYEMESLSPAAALATGQSLTHHHATIHIRAKPATLAQIARQTLGVDLEKVRQTMLAQ